MPKRGLCVRECTDFYKRSRWRVAACAHRGGAHIPGAMALVHTAAPDASLRQTTRSRRLASGPRWNAAAGRGLRVAAVAQGLASAWLYVLPNGDGGAETNGPPSEGVGGVRACSQRMQHRAGSACRVRTASFAARRRRCGAPSSGRDSSRHALPFGMALVATTLRGHTTRCCVTRMSGALEPSDPLR